MKNQQNNDETRQPRIFTLWRPFMIIVLGLCVLWEVIARPLAKMFFPDLELAPSFLREICGLLLPLLGLGG